MLEQNPQIKILNESDFNQTVNQGLVLVMFESSWCQPCLQQKAVFQQCLETVCDTCVLATVDIDDCPALAETFSIQVLPSLLIFNQGCVQNIFYGVQSRQSLLDSLNQILAKQTTAKES